MNPPLDFQQNPVEFVMDALRVARSAINKPCDCCASGGYRSNCSCDEERFIAKFDPPTVIALMEDWLRLREALEKIAAPSVTSYERGVIARVALAKQETQK